MNPFPFKFFTLLKSFSPEELKRFAIWLRSPWCNTNKNLTVLFEKTKKHYPHYTHQSLSKEKLFRKIFPDRKYNEQLIKNLLSKAYSAAEKFVAFQKFNQDQGLQKDIITKELQSRHFEDWFFKKINQGITQLENKEIKDWEDHLNLYRFHRRIYHHPNATPRMQSGSSSIVKMGEQIDLVYLLEKAAIINEKITRTRVLPNENHDTSQELSVWLLATEKINHPSINFYKLRFEYTTDNFFDKYSELRKAFMEQFETLNEKEKKIHLISLINDSTVLIRSKEMDIVALLPLYKLGLEHGFLLHNDILAYRTFATILTISNTNAEFDYSTWFIDCFLQKLDQSVQSDANQWALAHSAYYQKKFNKCLDLLLNHHFRVHHFKLISKVLTTQVYFDLLLSDSSYTNYFFNYTDSFEKWLQREQSRSKFNKISFLRFIQKCRTLAKYHNDVNFSSEQVKGLIEREQNIQAPQWLMKRIMEVIDRKKSRPLA